MPNSNNYRVQAPQIAEPDRWIAPSAVQQPAMAAPTPPKDTRIADLASALGAFNTGLTNFAGKYFAQKDDSEKEAEKENLKRVRQYAATHTPDEYVKNYGTDLGKLTPKAQIEADQTHGRYAADGLYKEYLQQSGEGKLQPADAPAWLAQRRQEIIEQNGWTPDSAHAAGFGEGYNTILKRVEMSQMKDAQEKRIENVRAAAFKDIQMTLDGVSDRDPKEAWAALNAGKAKAFKEQGMSPADYDQLIWSALGNRADKDPNWVVAMATHPRTGGDVRGSGDMPAIGDTPERQATVRHWLNQAKAFNSNKLREATEGTIAKADVEALVRGDGSFGQITDTNYHDPILQTDVKLSASSRRDAAVMAFEKTSQQQARALSETPEQTFFREASVFIGNGLERPKWKSQIETAPQAASTATLANPAVAKRISDAGSVYDQLMMVSPLYVKEHFNEKSRDFFNTASVLRQYARNPDGSQWSDAQVYAAAANGVKEYSPDVHGPEFHKLQQAIDNKIGDVTSPNSWVARFGSLFTGSDASNAQNKSVVVREVTRLSTALVRTGGISPSDAVDAAAKFISNTGTIVNGTWMQKEQVNGVDTTSAFGTVIKRYIDAHPDSGFKTGDLTVHSTGGGNFEITDRNGFPVPGVPRFTRADLLKVMKEKQEEDQKDIVRKQNMNAADAATPRNRPIADAVKAGASGLKNLYDMIDPPSDASADAARKERRRSRTTISPEGN